MKLRLQQRRGLKWSEGDRHTPLIYRFPVGALQRDYSFPAAPPTVLHDVTAPSRLIEFRCTVHRGDGSGG